MSDNHISVYIKNRHMKKELNLTDVSSDAPKISTEQKRKIDRETKKFLKDVRDFIRSKNNGDIPAEWSMSLMLLETYYRQFLQCTYELESLDSVVVNSRYGVVAHPLLKIQNTAAVRLEKYMSEMGLSLKSATKLDIAKPQIEESPLDKFVKKATNKVEKR